MGSSRQATALSTVTALIGIVFASCGQLASSGEPATSASARSIPIEFNPSWEAEAATEKAKWEPASLQGMSVRGDLLEATVEYVGSCPGGRVRVFAGSFKEKYPVYVSLVVQHRSTRGCSGTVRRTILIDLTPLRTRYRHAYGGDHDEIDIGLPPFEFYRF
jgi:hypothetical protein